MPGRQPAHFLCPICYHDYCSHVYLASEDDSLYRCDGCTVYFDDPYDFSLKCSKGHIMALWTEKSPPKDFNGPSIPKPGLTCPECDTEGQ